MKAKKTSKRLLKGFTKNSNLDKYADKVLFKEKVEKINQILKTAGLPKGLIGPKGK